MTTEQQEELSELSAFIKHLEILKTFKVNESWQKNVKVHSLFAMENNLNFIIPARVSNGLNKPELTEKLSQAIATLIDPLIAKAKEEMKKIIDAA